MANTKGEKELRTSWPNTVGRTARTTKQTGQEMNLVPTSGSLIPRRKKVGL